MTFLTDRIGAEVMWRRSKFGNIETKYAGILFRSKLEAGHALWLDSEKRKGRVKSWRYEVAIPLHAKGGKKIGDYVMDFIVDFFDGRQELHECKGVATALWRWKWKHLKLEYPNKITKVIWK